MDAIIKVQDVAEHETRSGHTRYVVRDADHHEYVTFRPQVGEEAHAYKGKTAHIRFHEEQRGHYRNVYLDAIEPAPGTEPETNGDRVPDVVGWQAAAAAGHLVVDPDKAHNVQEVFDELRPLKERIADDIRGKK